MMRCQAGLRSVAEYGRARAGATGTDQQFVLAMRRRSGEDSECDGEIEERCLSDRVLVEFLDVT